MDIENQPIDVQVSLQLLHAWKTVKHAMEEFAAEHDLTLQQLAVLYQLTAEDHVLMGTLAKQMHCDASNITGMADRLQSLGLLTRRELPEDRRAKQLSITSHGRKLIENLLPRLPSGLSLDKLTSTELQALHGLLAKACY